MSPLRVTLSPSELMRTLLTTELVGNEQPGGGIVVGPPSDEEQQAACVSIMEAGLPEVDTSGLLVSTRLQLRCIAPLLDDAERLGRIVFERLHGRNRVVVAQPSLAQSFLLHTITVVSGPSMHFDTPETWEELLFAETLIGTQPVT